MIMKAKYEKYAKVKPVRIGKHAWIDRELTAAPVWCSVDLRDGNQALPMPMNPEKKLEYFKLLCAVGFKEIEVSFPSASQDDFDFVRTHIMDAGCVVFATPMYYFGISSQLKAVIDRFYAINGKIHVPKKAVLLMTYANTAASEAVPIKSHYEVLLRYLGWTDAGQIIAPGVWPVGAINRTKYPEQAYQLGKKI